MMWAPRNDWVGGLSVRDRWTTPECAGRSNDGSRTPAWCIFTSCSTGYRGRALWTIVFQNLRRLPRAESVVRRCLPASRKGPDMADVRILSTDDRRQRLEQSNAPQLWNVLTSRYFTGELRNTPTSDSRTHDVELRRSWWLVLADLAAASGRVSWPAATSRKVLRVIARYGSRGRRPFRSSTLGLIQLGIRLWPEPVDSTGQNAHRVARCSTFARRSEQRSGSASHHPRAPTPGALAR
jgi:hypothetical protein